MTTEFIINSRRLRTHCVRSRQAATWRVIGLACIPLIAIDVAIVGQIFGAANAGAVAGAVLGAGIYLFGLAGLEILAWRAKARARKRMYLLL